MNGISVIVCCYNSALRLPLALEHLARQKTDANLKWEIIIVNNNSKDNTAETALTCWKSLSNKRKLKVLDESKPGLSYAREAGIKAAAYDIVIFCDDDNLLAENYLQYSYELVEKTKKSRYGIWGGNPNAYFDVDTIIPEWFEKEKANYVVGKQGKETGDISYKGYVWGAGMVILKSLFLLVTNNDMPLLLTGRKQGVLLAGDDSEICLRSLILGYKLYYDDKLLLKHYIPKDKLTKEYNEGLMKGFAASNTLLNKYKIFIHYISNSNWLFHLYYLLAYSAKYILSTVNIRKVTEHDNTVFHALFQTKKFSDTDFDVMRNLLKLKTKNSL